MSTDRRMSITSMRELAKEHETQIYKERINALINVYGSVRGVSRALKIDHAYLHRLACGKKTNPSKAVLRKLGLA